MQNGMQAMNWMIHPTHPEHFVAEFWEKQHLHISRDIPNYYSALLTLSDFDRILGTTQRDVPGLRLVKNEVPIPLERYASSVVQAGEMLYGTVDISKVFDEYSNGSTIVVDTLNNSWKPLGDFTAKLERFFSHRVRANVYLTPKGGRGLVPHYDTHDVFVLQVHGSKVWQIHDTPIQLPLKTQPSKGLQLELGEPRLTIETRQGDLLYIPRGLVHSATANQAMSSLHITIGILATTWADVFRQAVTTLCEREPRLRRALPIGYADKPSSETTVTHAIDELLQTVGDIIPIHESLKIAAKRFLHGGRPLQEGRLIDVEDNEKITLETIVSLRSGTLYSVNSANDSIAIEFNGKCVTFPWYVKDSLHSLLTEESKSVRDVAGCLTDEGKVVLVRKLVKEGLLTTVIHHYSEQKFMATSDDQIWREALLSIAESGAMAVGNDVVPGVGGVVMVGVIKEFYHYLGGDVSNAARVANVSLGQLIKAALDDEKLNTLKKDVQGVYERLQAYAVTQKEELLSQASDRLFDDMPQLEGFGTTAMGIYTFAAGLELALYLTRSELPGQSSWKSYWDIKRVEYAKYVLGLQVKVCDAVLISDRVKSSYSGPARVPHEDQPLPAKGRVEVDGQEVLDLTQDGDNSPDQIRDRVNWQAAHERKRIARDAAILSKSVVQSSYKWNKPEAGRPKSETPADPGNNHHLWVVYEVNDNQSFMLLAKESWSALDANGGNSLWFNPEIDENNANQLWYCEQVAGGFYLIPRVKRCCIDANIDDRGVHGINAYLNPSPNAVYPSHVWKFVDCGLFKMIVCDRWNAALNANGGRVSKADS